MCPYYLDGDLGREPCGSHPVIPVSLATVQFSRSEEANAPRDWHRPKPDTRRRNAGLSKLNSMRAASLDVNARCTACQIRSTYLVADRVGVIAAELESSGDDCPHDRCPLV
jgi:hypothetical protein